MAAIHPSVQSEQYYVDLQMQIVVFGELHGNNGDILNQQYLHLELERIDINSTLITDLQVVHRNGSNHC